MSDKTKEIVAELEYTKENGDNIHSDLDFDFEMKEEIRKPLHDCLDEWLDKSNGNGGFYLRNANHHFEDYFELLEKPKRKPLPDGTLPMTESEFEEFSRLFFDNVEIKKVFLKDDFLKMSYVNLHKFGWLFEANISQVKAILYLANLFDLEV